MKPAELRSIRRRLGLTQRQMAQRLGIALSTYADYENGKRVLRRVVLYAALWVEHKHRRR